MKTNPIFSIPTQMNSNYWLVNLEDIVINGLSYLGKFTKLVLLDTGSSFISLPSEAYYEIVRIKFGNQHYCENYLTLFPTISFRINGQFFSIKPVDYITIQDTSIFGTNSEFK